MTTTKKKTEGVMVHKTFEMSGPSALWTSPHFKQRNTPIVADLKWRIELAFTAYKYKRHEKPKDFFYACFSIWFFYCTTWDIKTMHVMLYSFSHKMIRTNDPIYLNQQKILCKKAMQTWLFWNRKGHKFLYINDDFISLTVPLTPIWDQVHHNQHIYDCRFSS
jgi:hypothetical protein